jgi:amidohydrolase
MSTRVDELKRRVIQEIDSLRMKIAKIGDYIYRNPELPYQEHKACALLTKELRDNGFDVKEAICGLPTAFRATIKGNSAKPTIAILAEYDALPGLGHACGHNLSAAAAVGAALGFRKFMPEIEGTVAVFGTPAEEGIVDNAGGKVIMLDEFRAVDAAMMIHASDTNSGICDSFNREALEIEFLGKAANAGNAEDSSKGINALEAVMLTWSAINAFRLLLKEDARVFGIITKGGTSPNIVPDYAATRLQIRVKDCNYLDDVVNKVKSAANGAALATGAKVNIRAYANRYEAMLNNRAMADAFEKNLVSLGVTVSRQYRRGFVTDMGNVSHVTPAIQPFIKMAPDGTAFHSIEAVKAVASKEAHEATIVAAKALAMTAIDLLLDHELAGKVSREFAEYSKTDSSGKNQ